MPTIAERIREGLRLRNMRQADLAEATGIGKSSISTYLSGDYEPKQKNIYKIAKALDVNEAWLMGHDVPIDGGYGALDPVLPPNMQGVNLDGAKIDSDFLSYMLAGLAAMDKGSDAYKRARNSIMSIARTSGLTSIACDFIETLEAGKKPTPVSESGLPSDDELVKLWLELSPEEAQKVKAFVQGMIANRKEPPSLSE